MSWNVINTPVGELLLVAEQDALRQVKFSPGRRPAHPATPDHPVLTAAAEQLRSYFAGTLTAFTIPLDLRGSDFERRVWAALRTIPYGQTCSYGEIAAAVGDRSAARAVGVANNRNPVSIIVPCHRVIGADGKLVGYGGGLGRKRQLLQLEARVAIERDFAM